jgi:hypothetical protein
MVEKIKKSLKKRKKTSFDRLRKDSKMHFYKRAIGNMVRNSSPV